MFDDNSFTKCKVFEFIHDMSSLQSDKDYCLGISIIIVIICKCKIYPLICKTNLQCLKVLGVEITFAIEAPYLFIIYSIFMLDYLLKYDIIFIVTKLFFLILPSRQTGKAPASGAGTV